MMALDSAIAYSLKYSYQLNLVWPMYRGLNTKFEDLFEIPNIVQSISYPSEYSRNKLIINLKVGGRKLKRLFTDYQFDKIYDKKSREIIDAHLAIINNRNLKTGYIFHIDPQYKNIFIRTDRRFFQNPDCYKELVPTAEILEQINQIKLSMPIQESIGVHIRRTDNYWAIKESPLEAFYERIQSILEKQPDALFYVATDSPDVEEEICKKFGNSILVHKKPTLARDDDLGIKHALIELYLLSSTKRIIGSHRSTYSKVASELGGIPLEIATSKNAVT